jgi:5-methyltetrahydropteroyltriglutamate--homocysteine methyltransferase
MNIRAEAMTAGATPWLPPAELRVTTTGAWARPGWYDLLVKSEGEGRLGSADIDELYRDYAVLAIQDQEECGLDILTDGEVLRKSWIRFIVKNVPGLAPRPLARKLGPHGWDQQETYTLQSQIEELASVWNYVEEYKFLRAHTNRFAKICMPGPYGITTQLDFIPAYKSRTQCAEALVPAIRGDILRLVAAGCDYIQIEEALTPGVTADDRNAADMVRLINKCVEGISDCTFILHICFGSSHRLPYAKRTYKGLFPRMLDANVHGFSLEFAAREMAEIEIVGEWPRDRILSAGLIDIKTHYAETPADIIERARLCLRYRDPERLEISSDCGFRHVPRNLTIRKYLAAAEAARRLRATG